MARRRLALVLMACGIVLLPLTVAVAYAPAVAKLGVGLPGTLETRDGMTLQRTGADCGLAGLATLAARVGRAPGDYPDLLRRYPVPPGGLSARRMEEIAAEWGVELESWRLPPSSLDSVALPAILHLRSNHYVVLLERRGSGWLVADPAMGQVRSARRNVRRAFSGVALLLAPSP